MNTERLQHVHQDSSLFVGGGVDSNVFIVPPESDDGMNYVAHFYKNHLLPEQLYFYVHVTNTASETAIKEHWKWNFGKHIGVLDIRIVPSREILFIKDQPVGISEWIHFTHCGGSYGKYFADHMEPLGRIIGIQLNVRGIGLVTDNAQFTEKNGTLFITDLCDDISSLKRRDRLVPHQTS